MGSDVVIRNGTVGDVPEILRQRRGMYEDMGYGDPAALDAMVRSCEAYVSKALADGSVRSWLACVDEHIVGGGAVLISPWPGHPYDLECRRATILNLYVYPEFRRKGIARKLMRTMLRWCEREKFAGVWLHASDDGRHLYEALGFEPSNEMRLKLRQQRILGSRASDPTTSSVTDG
jgi:GNAT superfamily N-acetyltransferase